MRRGRKRVEMESGVSVTSMMDMFTILLIYLLYFFDPSNDPSRDLQLATSTATDAQTSGQDLVLSLEEVSLGDHPLFALSDGHFGESHDLGPLTDALKSAHDSTADGPLVVRCDRRVVYEVLEAVLQSAQQAGFQDYRLVVMSGGPGSPTDAGPPH